MKGLLAIFIVLFAITQASTTPVDNTTVLVEETHTVVPVINIFTIIRSVIRGLMATFHSITISSGISLQTLFTIIQTQKLDFLEILNGTLLTITGDFEAAFVQFLTTGQIFHAVVGECINQQLEVVDEVSVNLLGSFATCSVNISTSIGGSITGSWTAFQSIAYTIVEIANQVTTCGVTFFGDLLETGSCVSQALQNGETMMATVFIDFATTVSQMITFITSSPTNVIVCSGSHMATAALKSSKIVYDVMKCSASAIASIE